MIYSLKNAVQIEGCDLLDRAFQYGDGCFTTVQLYANHVLLKQRHWQRLQDAAKKLMLNVDWSVLDQSLLQLKALHGNLNGTLKIVISRGLGQRGYSLPIQPADVYFIYFPAVQTQVEAQFTQLPQFDTGILQGQMGLSMPALLGVKSLNRLEQVMLKYEADQQQWPEAIVTDMRGQVIEGVSSNVFILLNKQWITPELGYNGVHGVMRAEILARMQDTGISCRTVDVSKDDIADASSIFFCNALSPMKIATQLDTRPLDVQPCVELAHHLKLDQILTYV